MDHPGTAHAVKDLHDRKLEAVLQRGGDLRLPGTPAPAQQTNHQPAHRCISPGLRGDHGLYPESLHTGPAVLRGTTGPIFTCPGRPNIVNYQMPSLTVKSVCLTIAALVAGLLLRAQQKPEYTQYILNNYILNPALTGIENYTDVKISHRHQWVGIQDAPVTTYLTVHGPLGKHDERASATS